MTKSEETKNQIGGRGSNIKHNITNERTICHILKISIMLFVFEQVSNVLFIISTFLMI